MHSLPEGRTRTLEANIYLLFLAALMQASPVQEFVVSVFVVQVLEAPAWMVAAPRY